MDKNARALLVRAATMIAAKHGKHPSSPGTALRKLFFQEVRNRSIAEAPRTGWKRGEIFEWLMARNSQERAEEWGDIGYYLAQTWEWLWRLYACVTSPSVIEQAIIKFEKRGNK
jgi:hypothetical protein